MILSVLVNSVLHVVFNNLGKDYSYSLLLISDFFLIFTWTLAYLRPDCPKSVTSVCCLLSSILFTLALYDSYFKSYHSKQSLLEREYSRTHFAAVCLLSIPNFYLAVNVLVKLPRRNN